MNSIEVLRMSSPMPTLGRIPFLMIRLGRRLHAKGLVGNAKFKVHIPEKAKPESES